MKFLVANLQGIGDPVQRPRGGEMHRTTLGTTVCSSWRALQCARKTNSYFLGFLFSHLVASSTPKKRVHNMSESHEQSEHVELGLISHTHTNPAPNTGKQFVL